MPSHCPGSLAGSWNAIIPNGLPAMAGAITLWGDSMKRLFRTIWVAVGVLVAAAHAQDPNPLQIAVSHGAPATYSPGQPLEIVINITASQGDGVTALGLIEAIPESWAFASARGISGPTPAIMPAPGTTAKLEFAWITPPTFPYSFAYTLNVPENANGPATISGQAEYRTDGPRQLANPDIITIAGPNNIAPKIRLNGQDYMEVAQGTVYQEPGFTATDTEDGDLTASVTISGSVDTNVPGEYTLVYSVQDSGGKSAETSRVVAVVARTGTGSGNGGAGNGGTGSGSGSGARRNYAGPVSGARAQANNNGSSTSPENIAAAAAGLGANIAAKDKMAKDQLLREQQQRAGELAKQLSKNGAPQLPSPFGAIPGIASKTGAATAPGASTPSPVETVKDLKADEADDLRALDNELFGANTSALPTDAAPTATGSTQVANAADAAPMVQAAAAVRTPGIAERVRLRVNSLGPREVATIGASALVLVGLIGFAFIAGRIAYAGPTRRKTAKPATAE